VRALCCATRSARPASSLTPKLCEFVAEAEDLRVHGLEPHAGAVQPGLQRLALARGRGLVHGVELRLCATRAWFVLKPVGFSTERSGRGDFRCRGKCGRIRGLPRRSYTTALDRLSAGEGPWFSGPLRGRVRSGCHHSLSVFPRAETLESSVRMVLIVVPPKRVDLLLRVLDKREPMDVQTLLLADAPVE
jgi:hypothetical protein